MLLTTLPFDYAELLDSGRSRAHDGRARLRVPVSRRTPPRDKS